MAPTPTTPPARTICPGAWCRKRRSRREEIKYLLSSHYQGTPYDPYARSADPNQKGIFRPIGVNRTDLMALLQLRPGFPADSSAVEWVSFASNAFNTMAPFYPNVDTTPDYLSCTTGEVSTDSFYWVSRMIAAMADASYAQSAIHIERYENAVLAQSRAVLNRFDAQLLAQPDPAARTALRQEANQAVADLLRKKASETLDKVLFELSSQMKNAFSRSDA